MREKDSVAPRFKGSPSPWNALNIDGLDEDRFRHRFSACMMRPWVWFDTLLNETVLVKCGRLFGDFEFGLFVRWLRNDIFSFLQSKLPN